METAPSTGNPVDALIEVGVSQMASEVYDQAVQSFREATTLAPNSYVAWNHLGVALARQRLFPEAIRCLQTASRLKPGAADIQRNLARAFTDAGRLTEAVTQYRDALRLEPDSVAALQNLGHVYRRLQQPADALPLLQKVVQLEPNSAEGCHEMGLALSDLERRSDAQVWYEKALALRPEFPEALNNLGIVCKEQGRLPESIEYYRRALQFSPKSVDVLNNLGVVLADQQDYSGALQHYEQALQLAPDSPLVLNNYGNALRSELRFEDAVKALEKSIRLKPDYAEAHNNLGIALVQLGHSEHAIACYRRALLLRPDYPEAHLNLSLALLGNGDIGMGGWEYEWRWLGKKYGPRKFQRPVWDGSPVQGRTLLLYAEQGLGDTIQFIRYAQFFKARGARIIVEVQACLLELLASCPAVDQLYAAGSPPPDCDFVLPLLSTPWMSQTTLSTIPAEVPYLAPDEQLVERWREYLAGFSGLKVGIAWQGNKTYRGDRQRSISLEQFAQLGRVPGVQLFSLQKGEGTEQLQSLDGLLNVHEFESLDANGGAFLDTAAILKNLDLIIVSDSAIVHLAGALGVPAWVAIPFAPDWRWLRDRDDSPWYPSVRLFRQKAPGDWSAVFEQLARELAGVRVPARSPDSVPEQDADYLAGIQLAKDGDLEAAAARFKRTLLRHPDFASAHNNLGVVWARLRKFDQARPAFERAIQLQPRLKDALKNLGLACLEYGDPQAAVQALQRAIRQGPSSAEIYNNLGVAHLRLEEPVDAEQACRQALQVNPRFAQAHVNLSTACFKQRKYDEASWAELEWRWKLPENPFPNPHKPRWTGTPLCGQTVLIDSDGSFGDHFQFARFATLVKDRGGRVVLECPAALSKIMATCSGVDGVTSGPTLPDFDQHIPLRSLPGLLAPGLHHLTHSAPYLFSAAERTSWWRRTLGDDQLQRVGLLLSRDCYETGSSHFSAPDCFARLGEVPGVRLVDLYLDDGLPAASRRQSLTYTVTRIGWPRREAAAIWEDLAAALSLMHRVVTDDPTMAQLAGALGIETGLLIPTINDASWSSPQHANPWSATVREFRQRRNESWEALLSRVAQEIRTDVSWSITGSHTPHKRGHLLPLS